MIVKLGSRSTALQHSTNVGVNKTRNQIAKLVICNGIFFLLCQMPYRAAATIRVLQNMSVISQIPTKNCHDTEIFDKCSVIEQYAQRSRLPDLESILQTGIQGGILWTCSNTTA